MNSARKYLIPFPTSLTDGHADEDTVFAMPKPEKLFQPPRKWNVRKIRVPAVVSGYVCLTAVAAGTLIGVAIGRTTAMPSSLPPTPAPFSVAGASPAVANLPAASREAAPTVHSVPTARPRRFRFRLVEAGEFQRVGPFLLRLKKADEKRQTFSLTLQAKGSRVELQDRPLAESIRLNPVGEPQSELLVHRIADNSIEGFVVVQRAIR